MVGASSLTLILNNALSSLNVNQQALATVSQNISNANTPGYSRQILNQQAQYVNGQGAGVDIQSITRQVDQLLTNAVQQQTSVAGASGVINSYNTQIQQLMGQPGSNNSIDNFITDFFNNMQALAQTPENTTLQQTAVNSGVTLAAQMQQMASGLQNLQFQSEQDIASAVAAINSDLQNLSHLNTALVTSKSLGQSISGLQDQEDSVLKDLSQYLNIKTFSTENGAISVTTSGGVTLLDSSAYKLNYTAAGGASVFSNGTAMFPITVQQEDQNGDPVGQPIQLVSGGPPTQVTSTISSGKLAGLLTIRDQQIPDIMSQLDTLAASVRDQVNTVSNSGSAYPGASSYVGGRLVSAQDFSQWGGSVRIAVLGTNGQPIPSPYGDEPNGVPPLNLDLSTLDTGSGAGNPSVQGIINAINQYYGTPQNKAEVGNLNNIQLVSDSANLPGVPPQFNFDFDLNNISANSSNFYITGVTVADSSNTTLSTTSTVPTVALAGINTYQSIGASKFVTVNTAGTNNLTNGETVFLSTPPAGTYGGHDASNLGGYFTVSNVTPTSFQITVADNGDGSSGTALNQTATPPYATVPSGADLRTSANGLFSTSLVSNPNSPYYTVTVNVGVDDGSGTIKQSQITYQVLNQQAGVLNAHYAATQVSGQGTLVTPASTQALAQAILVDAQGHELPKINGQYIPTQPGYLEIKALGSGNVIAIDSLDSVEQGKPNDSPAVPGTNQGFSSYFNLNNFFKPNQLTGTGDTVAGSALNLQVEQSVQDNPSLMSIGALTPSTQPTDPTAAPNFTYQRNPGDNTIAQRMADLGVLTQTFAAAGGLGATTQSFTGYAGQIIGSAASSAATAKTNDTNANTLLDGYTKQASSVVGVNLDTELANTVIYQNAYAASARIVTVTNSLFTTLIQSF